MWRILAALVAVALTLPALGAAPAVAVDDDPDTLLVRWADDVGEPARADTLSDAGVDPTAELRPVTRRVDALEVGSAELDRLAQRLDATVEVELVERDQVIGGPTGDRRSSDALDAASRAVGEADPDEPSGDVATSSSSPDDDAADDDESRSVVPPSQLFEQQWGLENTGQELGPLADGSLIRSVPGIDVRAPATWEQTFGAPDVVVGVIDTPIDLDHPELRSSVVGKVDLIDVASGRKHGTQVASVIAAGSRHGGSMLGLAPEVGLLSIGAFIEPDDGTGTVGGESSTELLLAAFDAAEQAQVDVVNASWVGGMQPDDSAMLEAAIADLGIPVVAASGNRSRDLSEGGAPRVPVGFDLPNLISVTAVDPRGEVPTFANVGRGVVDVGAPGVAVLAGLPGGQDYHLVNGTSFAAPFVSAAIALGRVVEPEASPGELVDAVRRTSQALPSLAQSTTTGGMLDAASLVEGVPRPVCGGVQPPAGFPDVAAGAVHARSIDCIAANGVTSGRADGTFGPGSTVSRAEMATFLSRIIRGAQPDLDEPEPADFSDVDDDHAHAGSIDLLVDLEVVRGYPDGTFRPAAPVKREQMATFLVRTYEVLVDDAAAPSRVWFDDTADSTHVGSIDRARDLGLVRGTGTLTYEPGASTRRDQMASLLARTLDALAREDVVLP